MVKLGDKCLVISDSWESLHDFKVVGVEKTKIELRRFDDYFGKGAVRTVTGIEMKEVVLSPIGLDARERQPSTHQAAQHIINLSSSLVRSKPRYPLADLLAKLAENPRLEKIPPKFIEASIRSAVASNFFSIWWDARKKAKTYCLELSPELVEHEKNRAFAGSFASELSELSDRIRLLIQHSSTVGTYRENLLQTLLRKNVPERYHVATGFIYGCPRQLDILIYDRIEYAPLFREGDLVVVPKAAVRAVIEVKTDLTKDELKSSLQLLDEVAAFDDGRPPFFRGIFGFESSITADAIYAVVTDFHKKEYDLESPDEEFNFALISLPFQHLTCVCVLGHAFASVEYLRNTNGYLMPTLVAKSSATGLKAQAAYFQQHLLSYLRPDGRQVVKAKEITTMLGADTQVKKMEGLTPMELWGAYFEEEEGMPDSEDAVKNLEGQIAAVYQWLEGGSWPT